MWIPALRLGPGNSRPKIICINKAQPLHFGPKLMPLEDPLDCPSIFLGQHNAASSISLLRPILQVFLSPFNSCLRLTPLRHWTLQLDPVGIMMPLSCIWYLYFFSIRTFKLPTIALQIPTVVLFIHQP